MKSQCAICWVDPVTKKPGSNNTSRICSECKRDPANAKWSRGSRKESGGFDMDSMPAGSGTLPARVDPYTGPIAIEIMRLWCYGVSQRRIAADAECQLSYVIKTIAYWKKHRGEKLRLIQEMLQVQRGLAS